jgi:TRAP-type C4-dicarboxylate transport system permease small subunit
MLKVVQKISDAINGVVEIIVATGIILVALFVAVGIITRDVLGYPIIWLSETTMLMFSWTFFLGLSVTFKRNENICVELVIAKITERFKKVPRLLILALMMGFLGTVVYEGIEIVSSTAGTDYNTIDVSTAWFYASFPVSALISLVHLSDHALSQALAGSRRSVAAAAPSDTSPI